MSFSKTAVCLCVNERGFPVGAALFVCPTSDFTSTWRCIPIATNKGKNELEINGAIRDREVRLIGADGSQLGVMSAREALRLAEEKNLDLVKIAPQAVDRKSVV